MLSDAQIDEAVFSTWIDVFLKLGEGSRAPVDPRSHRSNEKERVTGEEVYGHSEEAIHAHWQVDGAHDDRVQ